MDTDEVIEIAAITFICLLIGGFLVGRGTNLQYGEPATEQIFQRYVALHAHNEYRVKKETDEPGIRGFRLRSVLTFDCGTTTYVYHSSPQGEIGHESNIKGPVKQPHYGIDINEGVGYFAGGVS